MEFKFNINNKNIIVRENLFDKVVRVVSPGRATERLRGRVGLSVAANGGYYRSTGSASAGRSTIDAVAGDPDAELGLLPELRLKSRHIRRNTLGASVINTSNRCAIGPGLMFQSRINRKVLGMSRDQAKEWQDHFEAEFGTWAKSKDCDISRERNFYENQPVAFNSTLSGGDSFVLFPREQISTLNYSLRLQLLEAERCSNKDGGKDTTEIMGGVRKNKAGVKTGYFFSTKDPNASQTNKTRMTWDETKTFSASNRRNLLHLMFFERPGQTRGIPFITPILDELNLLDEINETRMQSALVSSIFAAFYETAPGGGSINPIAGMAGNDDVGADGKRKNYKFKPGVNIFEIARGDKFTFADLKFNGQDYDLFMKSTATILGGKIGVPHEIILLSFQKSFVASKAAFLMAWKLWKYQRQWMVWNYCDPIVELFMEEAVLKNRIDAPGFLDFPEIRAAYLRANWIGPTEGQINSKDEMMGTKIAIEQKLTTRAERSAALYGLDIDEVIDQRGYEEEAFKKAGLGGDKAGADFDIDGDDDDDGDND